MKNKLKLGVLTASIIAIVVGVSGYIYGITTNNPHITAFSTEIGGAGIVATLVSLLR